MSEPLLFLVVAEDGGWKVVGVAQGFSDAKAECARMGLEAAYLVDASLPQESPGEEDSEDNSGEL